MVPVVPPPHPTPPPALHTLVSLAWFSVWDNQYKTIKTFWCTCGTNSKLLSDKIEDEVIKMFPRHTYQVVSFFFSFFFLTESSVKRKQFWQIHLLACEEVPLLYCLLSLTKGKKKFCPLHCSESLFFILELTLQAISALKKKKKKEKQVGNDSLNLPPKYLHAWTKLLPPPPPHNRTSNKRLFLLSS